MIKPMRILAVGDESTLESLKTSIDLVFPESKVFKAKTEKDGIEQAVLNEIDIIFAVIRTHLFDGIELLSQIRNNNRLNNIPFIFLINNDNKNLKTQALQHGADAFLSIPIDSNDLIAVTQLILKTIPNSQKPDVQKMQEQFAEERISELVRENRLMQLQLIELQKGIEQHKKTLKKLKQSEAKFRKLFEDHKAVKLLIDPENGNIIDANDSAANFYMWTREELRKMNIKQINIHSESEIDDAFQQVKKKNREYFEFKHRTALGSIRDVAIYTSKISIDGRILLHSIIHDISEHRRIYEALVANESRLNRAELASKTGNWELHLDTKEMFASSGAKEIYGLTGELFDYQFIKEIPLPEYRSVLDLALINLVKEKEPYKIDFKIRSFDTGSIKDIHSEAFYDTERKTIFGIIQDVTEQKLAEEKIKESEEKYRLMFETALEGILIAQDFKLIFFNPVIVEITGYSESELLNMPFLNLVHPDYREVILNNYKLRLEGKTPAQNYEFKIIRKDGETRWVVLNGAMIQWNGKPATFNFINDITVRKNAEIQLKANEEKYRMITENTFDVIWILNLKKMRFTYVSPSIFEQRGYTSEEAMSQTLEEVLTSESLELVQIVLADSVAKFLNGENPDSSKQVTQIQQPCKDGSIIWVEIATQLQYNSEGDIEVLGVSRNIQERKRLENELRELVATKDKFFSIIAHDLKSPFTSIIGFSELLNDEVRSLDVNEIVQYARLINTSAKNTLVLLENLLDWAQLQRGQISNNPKRILLGELVKDVLVLSKQSATQKEIVIQPQVPEDLIVFSDENMLKAVMRNLIANAVKFTRIGGKVDVIVKENERKIEISVKDNGVGISKENLDKIFSVSSAYVARGTANEKGTGLGLILCSEFVEKLGGTIKVESEVGKGSNFVIELPKKRN